MAFLVALGCFHTRVTVLIACPPERLYEGLANGSVGYVVGLMEPLLRARLRRRHLAQLPESLEASALHSGVFAPIVAPLAGLPAAVLMKTALDEAFAPGVLSRGVKALMFGVVARALDCRHTEAESRKLLTADLWTEPEIDGALTTLHSPKLEPREADLLVWARDTVHYQTGPIQQTTRALCGQIGELALLEAVGIAALANSTVRLAMLLE